MQEKESHYLNSCVTVTKQTILNIGFETIITIGGIPWSTLTYQQTLKIEGA